MDIFIDKFAQRRNAQEMIKANYMAEAEENERLTAKLSRYDEALQDMRRLSLQNVENAEKFRFLQENVRNNHIFFKNKPVFTILVLNFLFICIIL